MRDAGGGRGHLETGPPTPTCVFTNTLWSIKIWKSPDKDSSFFFSRNWSRLGYFIIFHKTQIWSISFRSTDDSLPAHLNIKHTNPLKSATLAPERWRAGSFTEFKTIARGLTSWIFPLRRRQRWHSLIRLRVPREAESRHVVQKAAELELLVPSRGKGTSASSRLRSRASTWAQIQRSHTDGDNLEPQAVGAFTGNRLRVHFTLS